MKAWESPDECSWCGSEHAPTGWFYDARGDRFCSRSHRDQSTAAVKRLRDLAAALAAKAGAK